MFKSQYIPRLHLITSSEILFKDLSYTIWTILWQLIFFYYILGSRTSAMDGIGIAAGEYVYKQEWRVVFWGYHVGTGDSR